MNTEASVRLEPTIIGTFADIAGAPGSNGCAGKLGDPITGRNCPDPFTAPGTAASSSSWLTLHSLPMSVFAMFSAFSSFSVRSMPISGVSSRSCDPDCTTQRLNSPCAGGIAIIDDVFRAPPLSP